MYIAGDYSLVAPFVLRVLPDGMHLRGHPCGSLFVCCVQPRVQRSHFHSKRTKTTVLTYFQWICSPACTELEVIVMDWAAQLFGLDKAFLNSSTSGGGCLQVHYFYAKSIHPGS